MPESEALKELYRQKQELERRITETKITEARREGLIVGSPENLRCGVEAHHSVKVLESHLYGLKGFFCPECYKEETSQDITSYIKSIEDKLKTTPSWDKHGIEFSQKTIKEYQEKLRQLKSGKLDVDREFPPRFLGYECHTCNGIVVKSPFGHYESTSPLMEALGNILRGMVYDCGVCGTRVGSETWQVS